MNSLQHVDIHDPIEMHLEPIRPSANSVERPTRTMQRPREVVFALMPAFNIASFGASLGPMRKANCISGRELYRWRVASLDGEPVRSSSGIRVHADVAIQTVTNPDLVLVCSGDDVENHLHDECLRWLRSLAKRGVVLGGVDTGACVLAKSGVLRGYKCTTQWDHRDALIEDHPEVVVTTGVCVFDRDRITCAGGDAPGDLMMNFIAREHGRQLAAAIAEQLVHDRIRGTRDVQRRPLVQHIGTGQPRLLDAVQLMEANLEEPLPVEQIAELVGLSRRQLERLFRRHLKCVPSRYYLRLRLAKAHHLLRQTSHSIMSIALSAGFVSASHFSKAYKDLFGYSPREERRPEHIHSDACMA